MLKWLVHCLKWLFKRFFGRKRKQSYHRVASNQVVQSLPELTNADLEFLFTQLLEGVHQGRGQQWAQKYLERMENRINNQRWIEWLLDFGEKLLLSPAPNNQLATRMVQLGELGIGTIGELAYEIGTGLLTRNLGEPGWEQERLNAVTTTTTKVLELTPPESAQPEIETKSLAPAQAKGIDNLDEPVQQEHQTITAPATSIEYTPSDAHTTLVNQSIELENTTDDVVEYTSDEQTWVVGEASIEQVSDQVNTELLDLHPHVAERIDELLVRLEQSTSLAQQLATELVKPTPNQILSPLEQAQTWFYQGLQQAKTGNLLGAIVSYNKAIEINPEQYEYWFNRGLTLFYLGNLPEAIASYDRAINIKPDFYKAWYNRGAALLESKQFEDAIYCFDQAIEIKFNYHEAWSIRGWALLNAGSPLAAISSYEQALLIQPEDQENWYQRGIVLASIGEIDDAIASYDRAIEILPDFDLAWYNRGVELCNLGRFEDGIASLNQALEINPSNYEIWYTTGSTLEKLGRNEEAIQCYTQAIEIKPDYHEVWIDIGVLQANLGLWEEAIVSWNSALLINPELYLGWFNSAVALENLGRREEAIACYDKAVEINPEFHLAWYNRGVALFYLERFEEAIASYDQALSLKLDYWEAWIARGNAAEKAIAYDTNLTYLTNNTATNPALDERGYYGKQISYEEGLKYVSQDTQPEGWGRLHLAIGNIYYDSGKRHPTPYHYWHQAIAEYHQALTTLTSKDFPILHLEVLQNLIKVYLGLGQTNKAITSQTSATNLLNSLLNEVNHSEESKKQLALKFAGFGQLAVDIAVQTGEIAHSLEIAEQSKNACLTWLLFNWEEIYIPSYTSIQKLLTPTTAIVYWHISPYALRTFILKHNSPEPIPIFTPVLNVATIEETPLPEAVERLVVFEDWLEEWNQQYQEYSNLSEDKQNKSSHSWQIHMEQRLLNLKNILNIPVIIQELEDITELIVIPHRDLHRLPLHALFHLSTAHSNHSFKITYLPSATIGLSLKSHKKLQIDTSALLTVENPHSTAYPTLKFAKLESVAISQMFKNTKRIQGTQATKKQIENALCSTYNIFHFTGHVINYLNYPQQSKLALAGEDKLTLAEICAQQITNYDLVTLSACTNAISYSGAIATEYVSLVHGFLLHGTPTVLSTLWYVESVASALVVIKFYQHLKQSQSPASALHEATNWLREVTASELKQWYEDLLNQLPYEGSRIKAHLATELYRSSKMPPEQKPYNHPYYWAAFTIVGKG
ncbi:CHAT domain-containing protein [Iningainema tapete]|uniref:Tetratricopeptide repeat protein n=1 Tax=Iningainema tapete BLCC-T55 TaxID=2748662 RepID=A0A8J7CGY8_9CYAN|nr:tetratricopeptide repeat protein [Iningainema tapete]MBD2777000.1 tetratricopeptide repeat protein [Iningainema tapete BLCC-T55]